jgi:hypothetical protein
MKRNSWILALLTLLMIGSAAVVLARFKSIQRLGEPAVKTRPIPGSKTVEVVLPEKVLDYTSEWIPQSEIVTNVLPKDTSYGQRYYLGPDEFRVQVNVVLMGEDRASLHKPDFCLVGAGWQIDHAATRQAAIRVAKPQPYDLPVTKLVVSREVEHNGQKVMLRGVYVYWYVADGVMSGDASGFGRMWSMSKTLITTGVLERWAYVSYFAYGPPGAEDVTYERLQKLIAASVPEFQLTPKSKTELAGGTP